MKYALIPLALMSCSCSLILTSPEVGKIDSICPVQSLACFDSQADITVRGYQYTSRVISQDLPTEGYANRWRYIIMTRHSAMVPQSRYGVSICGEAVNWPPGGMYQEARGYWRINMHPSDPEISAQFASLAGSHECRTQNFIVNYYKGVTEIMIEEPL